ncbi:MAG: class I SAM-dependent methyltransferase [Planctomycetota bacterium]|nr:class I SAM-dependent methyltransferase [Planctomycetota bacterium]
MEPHEQDPAGRFSNRAADYARFRPDYPEAALDAMFAGLRDEVVAADVGAGTGISARQLAERGARVFAIEPNGEMRAAAEPHPRVDWIDATAGDTGLEDACCDLVLCAQAFHWFGRDAALEEFRRILRPGGRMALIWNLRDSADPFQQRYTRVLAGLQEPLPRDREYVDGLLQDSPGFGDTRRLEFAHAQSFTLEQLLGRARSVSYFPPPGPDHERRIAGLTRLHEEARDAEGKIDFRYRTLLWLAERAR